MAKRKIENNFVQEVGCSLTVYRQKLRGFFLFYLKKKKLNTWVTIKGWYLTRCSMPIYIWPAFSIDYNLLQPKYAKIQTKSSEFLSWFDFIILVDSVDFWDALIINVNLFLSWFDRLNFIHRFSIFFVN